MVGLCVVLSWVFLIFAIGVQLNQSLSFPFLSLPLLFLDKSGILKEESAPADANNSIPADQNSAITGQSENRYPESNRKIGATQGK